MKKTVCLVLMLFMMTTVSFAGFTDVPAEHWAHPYIIKMQQAGILSGYYDGSFQPGNSISLGEFAAIFTKIFEISPDEESNYFVDIPESHWAKASVEAIREYINPYYDSVGEALGMDKYSYMEGLTPEMKMTREAFIYAICRIYGYDESGYLEGEEKEIFEDADKMLFPRIDMIAYKAGLVGGEEYNGKKYMRPERYITRAEASKVFSGLLKYEATRVKNSYEEVQLERAFTEFMGDLKECNIEGLTKRIYDTAGVLANENFKVENSALEDFVKTYLKKFSYTVKEKGFYSFNRGYLTIAFEVEDISIEEIIQFVSEHFDEEDFEERLTEFLKEQQMGKEKIKKEETICFAKQNNKWKIMMK
ncbi:MAG: S-layer homology domain-containing protein [Clostridia bacterium]|nr:S-layer homology domain-containing protein [Clostridia bacterium]